MGKLRSDWARVRQVRRVCRIWLVAGLHALWWATALASIAVALFSHPLGWGVYDTACGEGTCGSYFQMNVSQLRQLSSIGITPDLYGGLTVILLALQNLSSWVVGFLLYRYGRKDVYCVAASLLLVATGTIFSADEMLFGELPFINALFVGLNIIGSAYLFFLLLLPYGRFVPRWTAIPAWVWLAEIAIGSLMPDHGYLNAVLWPPWLLFVYVNAMHLLVVFVLARHMIKASSPDKRRQIRWLIAAFCGYIVAGLLTTLPAIDAHGIWKMAVQVAQYTSLMFIPFSIGVIVLETRARQMSVAFNRTMVYLVLSVFGVMAYALLVGALGVLVQGETRAIVALLATGLIAVTFQPLRELVQKEVNRLVYGEREDPYVVLSKLTEQLEASLTHRSLLPAIVEKVAAALRVPFVAIDVYGPAGAERLAVYGEPGPHTSSLELEVKGMPVGRLVLGVEQIREAIPPGKRNLAEDLVRQVSIAVQTVRLADDLQRSRERLVTAREEERRRLRRDLHDGLGSSLASMALRLDEAVHNREALPERSRKALETIQLQMRESIADIRRLVYSLRPPALDEFGLAFALNELILQYATSSLRIALEGAERELHLSAAAEVAVYRIVQEALTNVARHANASQCNIRVWKADGSLHIQIADNGRGIGPDVTPGVGVRSIRERAEELGGTFALLTAPGQGTEICVRLPADERSAEDDPDGKRKFAHFAG